LSDEAPDRCGIAMRDAFSARASALAQREDANSQLAYALAVPFDARIDVDRMDPVALERMLEQRSASAKRALMRAAELAPASPDVLFLAATQCGSGEACRSVQQALLAADPDNMAVWLYEMSWADRRDDPDATQRAFKRAAKATRNDSYAHSALQVLVEAYGDLPLPAECSSEQAKTAMRRKTGMDRDLSMLDQALFLASASRVMPAYNGIRLRCIPQTQEAMGTAAPAGCRSFMAKMADSDIWIERAVALDVMVQLVADKPDASAWRERYRRDRWMMAQVGEADIQRLLQAEDYWLDEGRAMQAALEVVGRWPPPTDWLPDDAHARSLIQTGRPPPPRTR